MWYVPTLDPRAGVLGVYDHPPAEGSGISSIPLLADGGVINLGIIGARRLTRLRDRISDALADLLT